MSESFEQQNLIAKEIDPRVKNLQEGLEHISGIKDAISAILSGELDQENVKSLIKNRLIRLIEYTDQNWIDYIREIKKQSPELADGILASSEIQDVVIKKLVEFTTYPDLAKGYCKKLKEVATLFSFPEKVFSEILKNAIAYQLSNNTGGVRYGNYKYLTEGVDICKIILENLPLSESDFSCAVQDGLLRRIKANFKENDNESSDDVFKAIQEVFDQFKLPKEILLGSELQEAILERIKQYGISGKSILRMESFPLPKDIFILAEVHKNGIYEIVERLNESIRYDPKYSSNLDFAIVLVQKFREAGVNIEQDLKIIEIAQKALLMMLRGKYQREKNYREEDCTYEGVSIIKIKHNFLVTEEFLQSDDYRMALQEYIIKSLQKGLDKHAPDLTQELLQFSNEFDLSTINYNEQVRMGAIKLFTEKYIRGDLPNAEQFLRVFHIPTDDVAEAIKQEIIRNIQGDKIERIVDIQQVFSLSPNQIEQILKPLISQELVSGNFEKVFQIKEGLRLEDRLFAEIDATTANSLQKSGLIKFVRYLGDENMVGLLPVTFVKAREMIFVKLSTDQDLADYFVENLDKYYQQPWVGENIAKAIQQYSVAQKFIYAVENDQTVWKGEAWVVDVFAKAKVIVEEHQKQFDQDDDGQDSYGYSHGNEGFRESDPFANHPWRFGGRQIRIASAISEMMAGKANTQGLKELGIKSEEISPLLAEANEKVNTAYQNFLEQIRSNTSIKDEDKQALLNLELSSVKITSLLNNIRSFVARYFIQSVEGDVTRLSEIGNLSNELGRILAEGFRRYIKIHEVDVPLYDKLYEEFDNLRETGRSPLEVYLGRDGIYAYIGRHSQDVARRRKLGLAGRKKLKEMGEVVEIHPQYTVYPRYFRDNLNYETKRQFLEQEGISPDADPLFYDTGYTGTIPEQIMRVMDFSDEDIERRIRLLSAPSVHRRVKGIPENARQEIIEYIEHNAKTEEAAEGLIIDKKTGKIRHVAKPTNPEEQFYFMMVKQAVARHYWLQEQLHHEPSGNVNLDSEHYTIRIRQEYAKLLPPDFMQNPKEFFTQHGEMLKGSKGEGEYPDEEVVLFKMTDGTEIVAKKIELRKAKEARKEFSILISAKKAGLPTAEPVGFLSGKEDTDGSYLLMKKIEGISGRNFDKYLRGTGKFTEEKIKSILQQVAQKNKEMAELFRTTLKIDKRWRIKDTIIELNEETGEVESVIPIDWERAQNFNPTTPKEIDEITYD